jgi:diaminohydroxyphosphoribosylaminopyrimidine deaminase/5-amino-6-(5-phosphoribosylamino)uracil reductase
MTAEADDQFMRAALKEARKGLGQTSPNPAVGAVLVIDNRVVATGHHRQAGHDHAEIECLRNFGAPVPPRATLYVTLEPCSTAGRTAPCTDAILNARVKNLVVGAIDPNPRHSGRGIVLLQSAGIDVRQNVLADECSQINEAFNKWIVTGQPFVIAKCGMSLDGRLTRPEGEPRWITDRAARLDARELRAQVDAVLVGAETVRMDNPRLTVHDVARVRQPWRVVLTRSGKLPRRANLFSDAFAARTLIFKNKSLAAVLRDLGKKDITSVLIEGGGKMLRQALDGRLIDKVQLYVGPVISGGAVMAFPGRGVATSADALRLRRVSYRKIGQSVCITGYADTRRV